MGIEVGDDLEMVRTIIRTVRRNTEKPTFIKLGVGNVDVLKIASIAKDEAATGITAINTIRAMTIDIQTCSPVLSNKIGGLSGRSIKPVAVRTVYEISKKIGIPVIGCGGIFTWEDAVEFILAGASAVQIGSGIGNIGINIFKIISRNVQDIVGMAHKY